jgi:hypothetical protein
MDFLTRPFLIGGAAAAIPVIIHLVQRRRMRQVVFGSLRFLRKAPHHIVHRRRFEEVLLVILRALAMGLLAAVFARPFFPDSREAIAAGGALTGEEAALVLIDNSYSMLAPGRLDKAKQEALKALHEMDPATKVGVAAYSTRLEELCPVGSSQRQAIEAIGGIAPSWRGTRLDLALKQADRLLTRAGRNEVHRRIVLVGDFQDSAWQDRGGWTLSPGTELVVRNIAPKPVPNVYVSRVAVPRLVVAGGFVEVVSATVRNLTDKPLSDAAVTFRVGGQQKGVQTVNVRPGEEAPVRFRHKFTEPGDVTGSISVQADDTLPGDNAAWFCVPVTSRVHVLLVNADSREEMTRNDGLFVKTALVPDANGVVSPFEVREITPERMTPANLSGVDVVLLINVSSLPAEVTRVPPDRRGAGDAALHSPLGRFLATGGGLGFICGGKIQPAVFNRTFDGLAPCELVRLARQGDEPPVAINQVDLRHEVFSEFALPHSGDFSSAEFTQYFLVSGSLRARVPARFSNADAHPALLERTFDAEGSTPARGKSILFVSSMDLEWSNLCLKSVFVPFVHQLTKRLCARRSGGQRNYVVGDEISYRLPAAADRAALRRLADKAHGVEAEGPEQLTARAAGGVVSFPPQRPGIYELAWEGGAARFAVNLDGAEADLRPLDTRLLVGTVRKGPALAEAAGQAAPSVAAKDTARERVEARQRLWWYLALAALVVLALEMLLAARIGRA